MTTEDEGQEHHNFHLFMDGRRFDHQPQHVTGAQIKALVQAPAEYQLFLEEQGDTPDKPLADTTTVDLKGDTKHFYAVPPATFGSQ